MRAQPVTNALRVIGFISTEPPWSQTWTPDLTPYLYALNQLLELPRLVRWRWQKECAQWNAVAVTQQVQLGAKAAARTP